MIVSQTKHIPEIGNTVQPDGWPTFGTLQEGTDYRDSEFPGCQFYLTSGKHEGVVFAVNIKVTGKPHYTFPNTNWLKSRCKVEFVQDEGKPSNFYSGWIFHKL